MEVVGYLASFAMGLILGIMGGGGSILTVPILVYLFGISPILATHYSLFVVGITALAGSILYIRKRDIDWKISFMFAIPSMIGVSLSRRWLIPKIPSTIFSFNIFTLTKENLIMFAFAILMITASYSMIRKKYGGKKSIRTHPVWRSTLVGFQGIIVGLVAGFVGAGGGFLIIPTLVLLAGLSMRVAIGTSLMIIAFQSLAGFASEFSRETIVNWPLLGKIAFIALVGITLGSTVAHKIKEQNLKIAFGWFVLTMGAIIFIEQFHRLSSQ